MKKLLALVLALLTLLPMIVACQDAPEKPSETTVADDGTKGPEETEDPYVAPAPKNDYKEHTFTILSPTPYGKDQFDREEMTEETINDAIYTRNRELEAYFNIVIKSEEEGWSHDQAATFKPYQMAGEDKIELIGVTTTQSGKPLITDNLVQPWNDVKYINLDKEWWNKSITNTLSVLGNAYYLSGDVNYNFMNNVMCTFFNKEVADVNKAIVGNPYELVNDGTWTFDTFNSMLKDLTRDNGDGVWDEKDTYAHLQYYHSTEAWLYGANYQTVRMTEDGPVMNIFTEKMQNIVNQVYNMLYVNHYSYIDGAADGSQETLKTIFFENRALFFTTTLGSAAAWRDQETDFGILPNPKYDEKQKEYKTYADQWGLVIGLPVTATDTDRTGNILEVMCAWSNKYVRVAVYDKTLIGKGIRDDESEEMLDIIFKGVLYDTGLTFATALDNQPLRSLVSSQSNGLASWWKGKQKPLTKIYQELFDHVKDQQAAAA